MERMQLLRDSQREEEGVTQEEMATRFELEKTESLLVAPSGTRRGGVPMGVVAPLPGCGTAPSRCSQLRLADGPDRALQSGVLCFVEDPEFGYKDFTRRGEQAPPTFRAQVGPTHPNRGAPHVGLWAGIGPEPKQRRREMGVGDGMEGVTVLPRTLSL